jgi:hypothetical protein
MARYATRQKLKAGTPDTPPRSRNAPGNGNPSPHTSHASHTSHSAHGVQKQLRLCALCASARDPFSIGVYPCRAGQCAGQSAVLSAVALAKAEGPAKAVALAKADASICRKTSPLSRGLCPNFSVSAFQRFSFCLLPPSFRPIKPKNLVFICQNVATCCP